MHSEDEIYSHSHNIYIHIFSVHIFKDTRTFYSWRHLSNSLKLIKIFPQTFGVFKIWLSPLDSILCLLCSRVISLC